MITVSSALIRGLRLQVVADPCEQECSGVGEIVACVGQQSQRVGFNASDRLDRYECRGRKQRPPQHGSGRLRRAVAVSMGMHGNLILSYRTSIQLGVSRSIPPRIQA